MSHEILHKLVEPMPVQMVSVIKANKKKKKKWEHEILKILNQNILKFMDIFHGQDWMFYSERYADLIILNEIKCVTFWNK